MLRVAQVGLRGFGRIHLERIDRLAGMGRVELVAGADPAGPEPGRDVPCYDSLSELLARHQVDVVSIATPIGTHMSLATEAMMAGAHVMLEKPPVASLAEFWELSELSHRSGLSIQVGFQSLGGGGIARMKQLAGIGTRVDGTIQTSRSVRNIPPSAAGGEPPSASVLGAITAIQVWGMWQRDLAYFKRSRWAGHRVLDGQRVADGVCTNALAHSIATACRIVDLTSIADIASIETELYHCFDTASDDTSWLRINRAGGPFAHVPIDVSLTLCGPRAEPPTVTLIGTDGWAELSYTTDVVRWQTRSESPAPAPSGSWAADPHRLADDRAHPADPADRQSGYPGHPADRQSGHPGHPADRQSGYPADPADSQSGHPANCHAARSRSIQDRNDDGCGDYTRNDGTEVTGGSPTGRIHTEQLPRTDLLENLVDHIENNQPLLVPLAETIGFMAALEATQTAPDPHQIPGEYLTWHGQGDQAHPVPQDLEAWQHRCLAQGQGYAAAGAAWATDQAHQVWVRDLGGC